MKKRVEEELGFTVSDTEYENALEQAKRKLQHIIHRYGDSDGARRSADYLTILVAEAISGQYLQEFTCAVTLGED